jgi:hypothetical protein
MSMVCANPTIEKKLIRRKRKYFLFMVVDFFDNFSNTKN